MYYQTQLLPLDSDGQFFYGRHLPAYPVGGEDTREVGHAQFGIATADSPEALRDVSSLCTLHRRASAVDVDYLRRAAQGQGDLARSGKPGSSLAGHYAENERAMSHAAVLAQHDTIWLPRRAAATRSGRVVLGFECTSPAEPSAARSVLRLIDLRAGRVLLEAAEPRTRLAQFHAVSQDATRVLGWRSSAVGAPLVVVERRLEEGLPEEVALPGNRSTVYLARHGGWIGISDAGGFVAETGSGRILHDFKVPPGCNGFRAACSPDGRWVVLPGERGAVWLLDLNDPGNVRTRRFDPHRGFPRGAVLEVAISDNGDWLATRAGEDLVATHPAGGVSWSLARIADQVLSEPSHGGWVVKSHLPAAFALVGTRLVLADGTGLRAVDLGEPPVGGRAFVSEKGRAGARMPVRAPAGAAFEALMKAARLSPVAASIRPHHAPSVLLRTRPSKKTGWLIPPQPKAPTLGASRFGGWPDLPEGEAWPQWQGRPMGFVAQIDLADAHAIQPALGLPKDGLLLFFIGCAADTFEPAGDPRRHYLLDVMLGTEPSHRGGWRVMYVAAHSPLRRQTWTSLPLPEPFAPCELRFAKGGKSLPDEQTVAYARLPLDATQRDDYNDLIAQLGPDDNPRACQLSGHPNLIQGTPPELMCELASRGESPWRVPQPTDADYEDVMDAASQWGLLLQLTGNADAGFEWGDGGHFYFYGRRTAMAEGNFEDVWVAYEN